MAVTTTESPHSIDIPSRRATPRLSDGGVSMAYLPPPEITRAMREIDPYLDLEWRPHGQWWSSWNKPRGAEPGCWRLLLRKNNGRVDGLRLWAPHELDGRFIRWLRNTWGAKLYRLRGRGWSEQDARDLLAAEADEGAVGERERFMEKWNRVDHGALRRAIKTDVESPKWRGGWQVPDALAKAS